MVKKLRPFEISTSQTAQKYAPDLKIESLGKALDLKYGDYDYSEDLREASRKEFEDAFKRQLTPIKPGKVLVTGANSGDEIAYLQGFEITALDLSRQALEKLHQKYPQVQISNSSVDDIPFEDDSFDMYVSMRTLICEGVDFPKALQESLRVTKPGGRVMYSIPNGYYLDQKIIKGMYVRATKTFDAKLPYLFSLKIKDFLDKHKIVNQITEIQSEIIIAGTIPLK